MMPLTKRQLEAKNWIAAYIAKHKVSPSLAEISEGLGCTESGGAYLVRALKKRGHVTRTPGFLRTLQLLQERRASS